MATLKGTACEERLYAAGNGTLPFAELGESCWLGVEEASFSALCLLLVAAIKVPPAAAAAAPAARSAAFGTALTVRLRNPGRYRARRSLPC